jgi:hypothetical protein
VTWTSAGIDVPTIAVRIAKAESTVTARAFGDGVVGVVGVSVVPLLLSDEHATVSAAKRKA